MRNLTRSAISAKSTLARFSRRHTAFSEPLESRVLLSSVVQGVSLANPVTAAVTAAGASGNASMSADGRFIAFESTATNLVPGQNDTNNATDVFLFDRNDGSVRLISGVNGSATLTANGASRSPVISSDPAGHFGFYIAYVTDATNIDTSVTDLNQGPDVYAYSLEYNITQLVSHSASNQAHTANAGSCVTVDGDPNYSKPSINSDGDWIAFQSDATNLALGQTDTKGSVDVFLAHRSYNTVALISHVAGDPSTTSAAGTSRNVALSADGSTVAFSSSASGLVDGQSAYTGDYHEFISDGSTNRLVSAQAGSTTQAATGNAYPTGKAVLSANGRYLAFDSDETDLVPGQVDTSETNDLFLFDRDAVSNPISLVTHAFNSAVTAVGGGEPAMSADGQKIAFLSSADSGTPNIYLYDQQANAITLVSHGVSSPTAVANKLSLAPRISADGAYVAFQSKATDLTSNANSGNDWQVFEASTADGSISLVTHADGSDAAAAAVSLPVGLSSDGRFVVFTSAADTAGSLIPTDGNGKQDVFLAMMWVATAVVNVLGLTSGDTAPSFGKGTDFGPVRVGAQSTRLITVENDGKASLTLNASTISFTGSNAGDFRLPTGMSLVVPPRGGTGTLVVLFTPTTTAAETATVTITSDDPAGPFAFDVTGSGGTLEQVPGTANLWLAGQLNQTTASGGDSAPLESPDQVTQVPIVPGNLMTFSATGSAGYQAGSEAGPNGVPGYTLGHGAENGIGGIVSTADALIGVFLSNDIPMAGNEPSSLDFSNPSTSPGSDYGQIAPVLGQPFFIGDGKSSTGVPHQVMVPAGATALYLGMLDGTGWYNNTGKFEVDVHTAVPQTISGKVYWDSNTNGVNDGEPGLKDVTIYVDANNNGILDPGEQRVITSTNPANQFDPANGTYQFTVPGPGDYWVRTIPRVDYGPVSPPDNAREINVYAGQDSINNEFGEALVAAVAVVSYNGTIYSPGDVLGALGANVFGNVNQNGAGVVDFTLANAGTTSLAPAGLYPNIHSPVVVSADPNAAADYSADFTVILQPRSGVLPGNATDFKIQFSPSTLGSETAALTLYSNDPSHPAYAFTVGGSGQLPPNLTGIVYHDIDHDGAYAGDPGIEGAVVYVDDNKDGIRDNGERYVTTGPSGFYSLPMPIPGTYQVRAIPPDPYFPMPPRDNLRTITVTAGTNNNNNNFGETLLSATAVLWQGSQELVPTYTDPNFFGSANAGDTVAKTFTIRNVGTIPLLLTQAIGSSNPTDFTVTQPASTSIAAGGQETFTVTFHPSMVGGAETADITVFSNDPKYGAYVLTLGGTGIVQPLMPRDQFYEYVGKVIPYHKADGTQWTAGEAVVDGYYIDKIFEHTATNGMPDDGFYAMGLVSLRTGAAVVSIRGSSQNSLTDTLQDVTDDTNPLGIGYQQFTDYKPLVEQWIIDHTDDNPGEQSYVNLTGHSLGGALAQLFAADLTHNGTHIGDVFTFNSPGISHVNAAKFYAPFAGEVHHYITAGDIVSMPGEEFIKGVYTISHFSSLNPLDKHLKPTLGNEGTPADVTQEPTMPTDTPFGLNSPFFFYRDADWFKILGAIQLASIAIPALQTVAPTLMFRGAIEAKRQSIGTTLRQWIKDSQFSVNAQGISVNLPNQSFNIANVIGFKATNLSVTYVEANPNNSFAPKGFLIRGKAQLTGVFNATINLAGNNYISATSDGWSVVADLSLDSPITIVPGELSLNSASFHVDTVNNVFSGNGDVTLPGGIRVTAGLQFVNGKLNGISGSVDGLNIPLFTSGLFLQGGSGSAQDILNTDGKGPQISGQLDVTGGPKINIPFPSWAGGGLSGSLFSGNLGAQFSRTSVAVSGGLDVFNNLGHIDAQVTVDSSGEVSVSGDITLFGGVITGTVSLNVHSDLSFDLTASGDLQIPASAFDVIPWGAGRALFPNGMDFAHGTVLLHYSNDHNSSDDYLEATGAITIHWPFGAPTVIAGGIHVGFDGHVSLIGGDAVKAGGHRTARNAANTTFAVAAGAPFLLLSSDWNNAITDAALTITTPTGAVLTESQFPPGSMLIVPDLTSPTHRAVYIRNPAAGNWKVGMSSQQDAGTIEFSAVGGNVAPTVTIQSVTTPANAPAKISYTARDPDSKASVSFYYDTNNTGFDGVPIVQNIAEKDAAATASWNNQTVPDGTYYIYSVADDSVNAPVRTYFAKPVTLNHKQTLSLSVPGATATETGTDGRFLITRAGPLDSALVVNYTLSGTATQGADYQALPGSITFFPGSRTAAIDVIPIDDSIPEVPELINLTLSPSAGYTLGTAKTGKIMLTSDETPAPDISVVRAVGTKSTALVDNTGVTSFGTTPVGGKPSLGPRITFKITNSGYQTLKMTAFTLPAGYKLAKKPVATLAAGKSDTLIIELINTKAGTFNGTVQIGSNDPDENPFDIAVTGVVRKNRTRA